MNQVSSDVLVLGSGVSGLTTAVCLAEAGLSVQIWSERSPRESTSCAAGAIYGLYKAGHERATDWSRDSLETFQKLAEQPDIGVALVTGMEASRAAAEPPDWATSVPDFRPCSTGELPEGFASGWRYTVPVVDMPRYLDYLVQRLELLRIRVEIRRVATLAEAAAHAPVVANCTGIGARNLVPDPHLAPVRGELVVMSNPGIDTFFAEHSDGVRDLTYLLPQGDLVVLGGSAEPGRSDLEPDPHVAAGIVARCEDIEPRLRGLPILQHRVGLRPTREPMRVEYQPPSTAARAHILHNYGHGGSGVSLSWGCARELLAMVARLPL